jgi:hypothetical protein
VKRILIFAGPALVVLWLLFPAADIVSPDWEVVVTDTEGHPIAGATVTVSSQQYTLERVDHEEANTTGDDGQAHFRGRRIRAMNLMRIFGALRNLDQGAHASFGVHTNLHADAKGYGDPSSLELFGQNERESRADGNERQSSHIVLLLCPPGYSGIGCSFPDDPNRPVLPLHH